ncbi:Prokaryotic metallothionein [Actinomycetospora sp. TBRC 11914]|uniref:Prokaryotic metallothionein n=1 Tax=Actinomycetospora sp. TBRC 11914 TaxID=2729387 RepID=UPI00145F4974|nr:Prokaryotic metallothionein [Actinomycetospora sp. TBRC 11914]NMO93859.1 Prokaryotic metallothionein [Actinomycetospora sp. TBRC 11914]
MSACEVCGNDYDKAFEIRTPDGGSHTFDSFECAAHRLAPRCEHCGVIMLGHGHEVDGHQYCCGHCAQAATG